MLPLPAGREASPGVRASQVAVTRRARQGAVGLMAGMDRNAALVAGNIFVVPLEGLVMFVQTTRLVLFEFFTRFMKAEGQVFKPLRPALSALVLRNKAGMG